mmetsp:Transcript_42679/g.106216  ORF Transcript_42679/g.106216 Transcript_42679/m.106216 type:complete len:287 (+) Transcript_42679:3-863(+)
MPPATPPPRLAVMTSDDEQAGSSSGLLQTVGEADCAQPAGSGSVLRLQGAKRRTVVLREEDVRHCSLQLIDCHASYIYVLAPVRFVEVLGCCGCTILLGAVQRVLTVHFCEKLKLFAACRALRLCNCLDTHVHACVNSPPLIWGENHRLFLAPTCAAYPRIEEHLRDATIAPSLSQNYWNRPADLFISPEASYSLLPAAKFLPFSVPFDLRPDGGDASPFRFELPPEYSAALRAHQRRLSKLGAELGGLRCSSETRGEAQSVLAGNFKDWLHRTGNIRQLHDLLGK